ncbi:MAG TPA: hypothetical protein DCX95_01630 [Elusimicrobia bacterium]|nr:hypothetical protein [Elusimicrobiota bacterium]
MKKYVSLLLPFAICYLLFAAFSGCASTKHKIKATSPNTEVVEAEGMSPIINNDITGAKKTSLHEAMKNALGLVIGVYVSQEALVSKAILIEDNITSQTEGYIEKYDVLKEWRDGEFYKTKIKALVRKEDLSAKLKALELEPKKLGNPVVALKIDEFIDGQLSETKYADSELKNKFIEAGFTVSDSAISDIIVEGIADSNFNTDAGLGGMISYRATVSVKVMKTGSSDVIVTDEKTFGGVDVTKSAAAKSSIINCAKKIGEDMPQTVLKFLRERSVVRLTVSNIPNMNKLNDFTKSVRALVEVRDCRVRNFSDGVASLDLDLKKGTATDIAKRLEQNTNFNIKITKTGVYDISAELK